MPGLEFIKDNFAFIITIIQFAVGAVMVYLSQKFAAKADVEKVKSKVNAMENSIKHLEEALKHLPDMETCHKLTNKIVHLDGKITSVDRSLDERSKNFEKLDNRMQRQIELQAEFLRRIKIYPGVSDE